MKVPLSKEKIQKWNQAITETKSFMGATIRVRASAANAVVGKRKKVERSAHL